MTLKNKIMDKTINREREEAVYEPPHYLGHRQRLKQKILIAPSSLADYELLELLLMIAIPRKDVKPLAKILIENFGSFSGVINAEKDELIKISGIGESSVIIFKIISASINRTLKNKLIQKPVFENLNDLVNYISSELSYKTVEEFHVLYLNAKNTLIEDETHSVGSINASEVYPRKILKAAISNNAVSVILVHNHPTSDTLPSPSDIEITKKIKIALGAVDIKVLDHMIFGKDNYYSFKANNIL